MLVRRGEFDGAEIVGREIRLSRPTQAFCDAITLAKNGSLECSAITLSQAASCAASTASPVRVT